VVREVVEHFTPHFEPPPFCGDKINAAGQRAVPLADAYPEPERGMHSELKFSTEVDKGDLSRAPRSSGSWKVKTTP
jgi:hypothetical protein